VRLIENGKQRAEREFQLIPGPGFLAPDVFVYWSETQPGTSVDPSAKLLGRLGSDGLYTIPVGSNGYIILYSVAQNELLGSLLVGGTR
jgi:hypothetical protein